MQCRVGELVGTVVHEYEHGEFELLAYRVERLSDWSLNVHDRAEWVDSTEAASYPLLPADTELIENLVRVSSID